LSAAPKVLAKIYVKICVRPARLAECIGEQRLPRLDLGTAYRVGDANIAVSRAVILSVAAIFTHLFFVFFTCHHGTASKTLASCQ